MLFDYGSLGVHYVRLFCLVDMFDKWHTNKRMHDITECAAQR